MGLRSFQILFDNPWSTYYGGQTVTGRVLVNIDSTKKIRGLKLTIKGEANTCWTTNNSELNNDGRYEDENQTISGHEEYFNMQLYLVGSASGGELELTPGEHFYPFTCSLPPNLPSSFESELGHVRYTVKATLDRPWKFDHEVKAAFTVVSPLDLNTERRAMEPIDEQMSKTFCFLCCASAPLNVKVSLPVRGYVPGQAMHIRVAVDNQSGVIVDTMKFILRKDVTYHGNMPRTEKKRVKLVVAEVGKGPIQGDENTSWEQRLDVPPLPPSNLSNCGIIELEYNLKIEACVSGWYHRNLKRNTLVFVGTVPLANYQAPMGPKPGSEDSPTTPADPTYGGYPSGYPSYSTGGGGYPSVPPTAPAAEAPSYPAGPPPQLPPGGNLYPNLPPPSYEESTYGARSLRDRGESEYLLGARSNFAPRYPVFKFEPQQ